MIKKYRHPLAIIICLVLGFGGGILYCTNKNTPTIPPIQQLINQDVGKVQNVDFHFLESLE